MADRQPSPASAVPCAIVDLALKAGYGLAAMVILKRHVDLTRPLLAEGEDIALKTRSRADQVAGAWIGVLADIVQVCQNVTWTRLGDPGAENYDFRIVTGDPTHIAERLVREPEEVALAIMSMLVIAGNWESWPPPDIVAATI